MTIQAAVESPVLLYSTHGQAQHCDAGSDRSAAVCPGANVRSATVLRAPVGQTGATPHHESSATHYACKAYRENSARPHQAPGQSLELRLLGPAPTPWGPGQRLLHHCDKG